jgi:hypothetical protein
MTYLAWYGYVNGISVTNPMRNSNFRPVSSNWYKHYKIRYNTGEAYTGGDYQGDGEMGVLFGTPQKYAPDCNLNYLSLDSTHSYLDWSPFYLTSTKFEEPNSVSSIFEFYTMPVEIECDELKGGGSPE